MNKPGEASEAISCTRAAVVILILSGLGISLLQPLETHLALRSLGKYIAKRHALAAQLDDLEHNPCFGSLSINNLTLSALSQSDCLRNRKPGSNAAQEAIELVRLLTNIDLIEKARSKNYLANYSLYGWKTRWNTLSVFYGDIGMWKFVNVKELSTFEFPEMSDYKQLFTDYQLLQVHTEWTPFKLRLINAGTAISLGMLFALTYFWLFFMEATKSGSYRRDGTIFAALSRTHFSRSVFFTFISLPAIVVLLLLQMSYHLYTEGAEVSDKSNPILDTILFMGVLGMSALIWRTAQIEWKTYIGRAS